MQASIAICIGRLPKRNCLIMRLGLILLLFFCSSCLRVDRPLDKNKRPIQTFLFKKHLSVRNTGLKFAYSLSKHKPIRQAFADSNWALIFSDEFDSLDLKKWRPGQPWGEVHPDNLHQYYDAAEVKTKGGYLYLGGAYKPKTFKVKDSLVNVPYAIGLINSDISFKQKYGYFEIRSKNPIGAATWPAFWLTGANRWPPEIDIFEMYGQKTGKTVHAQYSTVHWGESGSKSRGYLCRKIKLPKNTDSSFHVYGCLWTPNSIKLYTDGKCVSYLRVNAKLRKWLDDEMVVIINNCFEAKYLKYLPENFQSNEFVVDWIRVYTTKKTSTLK
jgi:hypothetical protein